MLRVTTLMNEGQETGMELVPWGRMSPNISTCKGHPSRIIIRYELILDLIIRRLCIGNEPRGKVDANLNIR